MNKGLLLVISGPSGAGKGTICNIMREQIELGYSISVTTRAPRTGEVNGVNYFFKTVDEAKAMIANDEFLEYAEVFGNYYGTPRKFVMDQLAAGKDVLLEIDIQGALQVKERYPEAVLIFIIPPSMEELERRLRGRATDSEGVILKRLAGAAHEMSFAPQYNYTIVNDVAERAANEIITIVKGKK
ncbi:MAG: guanylate kinase [Phascolarctobacterium sp.]|nr:guanylate kinase [Phascolarctobacterium sp.]